MKISDKGLLEIAEHEGIVPAPYWDSKGIVTYGVGHTQFAGEPDPREMNSAMPEGENLMNAVHRALEVFRDDLVKYEERVNEHIKVPLQQHEFDALVSFDFNTGGIWYRSSKSKRMTRARLVTAINNRDPKASEHFFGWLKPPELRKRRTAEKNLFDTGDYDANGDKIPVWRTNGKLKLTGMDRTLAGADVLKMMGRVPTDHEKPVPGVLTSEEVPRNQSPVSRIVVALLSILASLRGRR